MLDSAKWYRIVSNSVEVSLTKIGSSCKLLAANRDPKVWTAAGSRSPPYFGRVVGGSPLDCRRLEDKWCSNSAR